MRPNDSLWLSPVRDWNAPCVTLSVGFFFLRDQREKNKKGKRRRRGPNVVICAVLYSLDFYPSGQITFLFFFVERRRRPSRKKKSKGWTTTHEWKVTGRSLFFLFLFSNSAGFLFFKTWKRKRQGQHSFENVRPFFSAFNNKKKRRKNITEKKITSCCCCCCCCKVGKYS